MFYKYASNSLSVITEPLFLAVAAATVVFDSASSRSLIFSRNPLKSVSFFSLSFPAIRLKVSRFFPFQTAELLC